MRNATVFGLSFQDGFSFAGLFITLRCPGAPSEVFAEDDEDFGIPGPDIDRKWNGSGS